MSPDEEEALRRKYMSEPPGYDPDRHLLDMVGDLIPRRPPSPPEPAHVSTNDGACAWCDVCGKFLFGPSTWGRALGEPCQPSRLRRWRNARRVAKEARRA